MADAKAKATALYENLYWLHRNLGRFVACGAPQRETVSERLSRLEREQEAKAPNPPGVPDRETPEPVRENTDISW